MWNQLLSIYPPALEALKQRVRMTPGTVAIEAARKPAPAGPYGELPVRMENRLAIVDVYGVLLKGAPAWARVHGISATEKIAQAVTQAAADPDVDSIVLATDSPGGSVDGLSELGDAIATAAQAKPVVASVDGMAASGAYYAVSQASRIVAERTALLGSIGVRMLLFDFSEMFQKEGIRAIPIDTGEYKSAGAVGTAISEKQEADFQRIVDGYFADFVKMVARGRKVSEKTVRESWGTGQVWLAPEALQMRLVDGIATTGETVAALKSESVVRASGHELTLVLFNK